MACGHLCIGEASDILQRALDVIHGNSEVGIDDLLLTVRAGTP